MNKIDELLESGWAVTLRGTGYLEGPKWWTGTATAMGSICPRTVEIERVDTVEEAAAAFKEAIAVTAERKHDFEWTKDRIEKKLRDLEDDIGKFEDELQRVNQNVDLMGKPRHDENGVQKICVTCKHADSWTEHCKKGARYCKSWEKRDGK